LEEAKMKFVKKTTVSLLVGAVIGLLTGGLGALISAPRHWVTMRWIGWGVKFGIGAGAISGIAIATVSWMVARTTESKKICAKINETAMVGKPLEMLSAVIIGAVFSGIVGAAIELAIDVNKVLSSPGGMFFYVGDFSPAIFAPAIGVIVGIGYSFARKPAKRVIIGLIRGMISSILYGVGVGILWTVYSLGMIKWTPFTNIEQVIDYTGIAISLLIGAIAFGGVIGIVSEVTTDKLSGNRPLVQCDD
jgi:MFS family permease